MRDAQQKFLQVGFIADFKPGIDDTENKIICGETGRLSWFAVVEPNYPPTADAGGPYSVDEGSSIVVAASGSDPEGDPVIFAWDLDNNGTFETSGQSVTYSAVTRDGPDSQTIRVQVTDSLGLGTTDETTVNILNVAPSVGDISAPIDPIEVGTPITASADFTDPGTDDTHTAEWDWDDVVSPGTITNGTVSDNHTYTAVGVYTVTLTVTDDDGDPGTSGYEYTLLSTT